MQIALERKTEFGTVQDDDLEVLIRALRDAFGEFESIYYDWNTKTILTIWAKGIVKPFADLSDGQRGVILLFADLARRATLLNPHLGASAAKETDGIVIVDELDAHLHPAWQQKIVQGLALAFPKMQFIASTHSPFVVAELKSSSVFEITAECIKNPEQALGLNSDEINQSIFGVIGQNKATRDEMFRIRQLIEERKLNEAGERIVELEKKIQGTTQDTRELSMLLDWEKLESAQ